MTRAQKVAKAQELRAKGLTYREIGERYGLSESLVWRLLNPEKYKESVRKTNAKRHEAKLAWQREADREDRATCPSCGGSFGIGSGRRFRAQNGGGRAWVECAECIDKRVAERDRELEELWAAGLTFPELQDHFGWTKGHLGKEMDNARSRGADLGYRHLGSLGQKFPHLRRAA